MKILGSKFWALGGLNHKSKKTAIVVFVMENSWPKNGSIPSRNKKEEAMFVTNRQTDGQTDRVNDKNNRLLG